MKNDYNSLLKNLGKNAKIFCTLVSNEELFAKKIYINISKRLNCSSLFLTNKNNFISWITEANEKTQNYSKLETYILNYLGTNSDAWSYYLGDTTNFDRLSSYVLGAWNKRLNVAKKSITVFEMIYNRFVRDLNTKRWQNNLFTDKISLDDLTDSKTLPEQLVYEEVPYFENKSFEEKINDCKKYVIKKLGVQGYTPLDMTEMKALWDCIFDSDNFSYTNVIFLLRNRYGVNKSTISDSSLRYYLPRLRLVLLKYVINNKVLENYFNNDVSVDMDGKIKTIKKTLQDFILEEELKVTVEKKGSKNKVKLTEAEILEGVIKFCKNEKIPYKLTKNKSLVKLKSDVTLKYRKHYSFYVFKSGVYYDFYTAKSGYISNLIGKYF